MAESLRQTYLDPEILQSLDNMKLRARRLADGVLAGLHRSPHHGGSVEFSEYIEYTPGHELRHIDWNVYGKTDKFYVKQFEDETNLESYLLMDASGSMSFRGERAPYSKLEYASYLAATLAYVLVTQGDSLGAMGFADTAGTLLPAAARMSHLDDVFYLLEKLEGEGQTALDISLQRIAQHARRRSLVMVFSDFLDADEKTANVLRVLRSRQLDVALFHIVDDAELSLPYEGLTIFEGMEGDGDLLVDPDDIRVRYVEAMKEHCEWLEKTCHRADIGYLRTTTSAPLEEVCQHFLRRRT